MVINLPSDEAFMREALRQAQKAYEADEVPVGAVVVRAGKIIARAYNQVELLKDATAHAEMLALTQATSDRQGQNPKSTAKERSTRCGKKVNSPLFEIARVLMCLNHVASVIVNANHGIV